MPAQSPRGHFTVDQMPQGLRDIAERLAGRGHGVWWVGESLAHALEARPLPHHRPPSAAYELATQASVEQLLEALPEAVPINLRARRLMVPRGGVCIDVTGLRAGDSLWDWLGRRDFRRHAVALEISTATWQDPCGGLADLEAGRLGCPGDADRTLALMPVRALRAARLVAESGLHVDQALHSALSRRALQWRTPLPLSARRELVRMLLAPHAAAGIDLLRTTGLEAAIVPGASELAGATIEALPYDLPLRLAAWLPPARARGFLREYRFGVELSDRLMRRLQHHPLEQQVDPKQESAVRRLWKRLDPQDRRALLQLRKAELGVAASHDVLQAAEQLDALRSAFARIQDHEMQSQARGTLAIDGRHAMGILGCGPGPQVGAALRYLADRVDRGELRNDREALDEALRGWSERPKDTGDRR